jgi:hypothetical protein
MLPELPPTLVAALADAPLALLMLWMMTQLRRDISARPEAAPPEPSRAEEAARAIHAAREELSAFKLEVARTYVPLSLIRDMDARLTQQLGRLEAKLDEVSRAATAAAAISAQSVPGRGIGFGLRSGETEA